MSYEVWLDGAKIGDTSLEIKHGQNRRAGIFHPTAPGLAVLPVITALAPALLEAGRAFREAGLDADDPDLDIDKAAAATVGTLAGQRVLAAGELISRLELRRPDGRCMLWESILISDMNEIAALARSASKEDARAPGGAGAGDPVRYFISTKLTGPHRARARLSRSLGSH